MIPHHRQRLRLDVSFTPEHRGGLVDDVHETIGPKGVLVEIREVGEGVGLAFESYQGDTTFGVFLDKKGERRCERGCE